MSGKMMSKGESRRQKRAASKRIRTVLLTLVTAALVLTGALFWIDQQRSLAAFDYEPDDVSYEQPFTAIHDMGPSPTVPFLPRGDPQPEILISSRFHDFGVIGSADVVSKEFVIANVGAAPLTISRAYTTCGCTTAEFTSAVIPPGMVSIVTVQLDAGFHDLTGQTVRRGLVIESNDPGSSSVEFWIQATVR